MQLTIESLTHIATNFNQTVYDYSSDTIPRINPPAPMPTETVNRSYLLDINPAYASRSHGNGENVIDGRFIDMRNGLYIDLTAVSQNEPSQDPGVWSDKNEHQYKTRDLYPLRATLFEGVMTQVPYSYVRILSDEYEEKALVITEYEGHRWNYSSMLWTKKTPDELRTDREEMAKKKAADRAKKKKEKAAKAKAKAKASKTSLNTMDEAAAKKGSDPVPEKDSVKRLRRLAMAGLVAELEADDELMDVARRKDEREDVV